MKEAAFTAALFSIFIIKEPEYESNRNGKQGSKMNDKNYEKYHETAYYCGMFCRSGLFRLE